MRYYYYHRVFRLALLAAQAALLGTLYYANCGAASPVTGVPVCRPWLPPALLPVLPRLINAGALPGASLLSYFYLGDLPGLPDWLGEWGWTLAMAGVNVLAWTVGLGGALLACVRVAVGLRPGRRTA